MNKSLQHTIDAAVERGITAYVAERKARVPGFVARHFSFRGALSLHRKTFGRDFLKHPFNLLWGLPAALIKGGAALLGRAGAGRLAARLERMPAGIPTTLEKELRWLIYTELLELPCALDGRVSRRDALMEAILADPELAALCEGYLQKIQSKAERPEFRAALERNLAEYGKTRGAVSDLAGSLLHLAAGYAALHQLTPGALSAGTAAATALVQQAAITNFWLGSTLGSWYYSLFPVAVPTGLAAATTGALVAAAGMLAALSWIVIDPLFARIGFHRRRLDDFVSSVEQELRGGNVGYRVRDHYAARIFDLMDVLRAAAKALS